MFPAKLDSAPRRRSKPKGGSGGPPRENFEKLVLSPRIWEHFWASESHWKLRGWSTDCLWYQKSDLLSKRNLTTHDFHFQDKKPCPPSARKFSIFEGTGPPSHPRSDGLGDDRIVSDVFLSWFNHIGFLSTVPMSWAFLLISVFAVLSNVNVLPPFV